MITTTHPLLFHIIARDSARFHGRDGRMRRSKPTIAIRREGIAMENCLSDRSFDGLLLSSDSKGVASADEDATSKRCYAG